MGKGIKIMKQSVRPTLFLTMFSLASFFTSTSSLLASPFSSNGYNRTANVSQNQNTINSGYSNVPIQQQIITVADTQTGTSLVLGGTVVPLREVTLSAQVPGRIEFLAGIEGDWFQPGQVIAVIDDDDLRAKRRQAVANINGQVSALQSAQVQYSREFWSPQ